MYMGREIPASTPMTPMKVRMPDGTIKTEMRIAQPAVVNRQEVNYEQYVEDKDKRKLFFNPNAGPMSVNAPEAANVLNTTAPTSQTVSRTSNPGGTANYNKVNGFGRNNKMRNR